MAYSSTNPVRRILDAGITSGQAMLVYESSHASSDIVAANFFAGAGFGSPTDDCVGLKIGDLLCNVNTVTNAVTWHRVTSLTTSTGWHSPIHATVAAGSS